MKKSMSIAAEFFAETGDNLLTNKMNENTDSFWNDDDNNLPIVDLNYNFLSTSLRTSPIGMALSSMPFVSSSSTSSGAGSSITPTWPPLASPLSSNVAKKLFSTSLTLSTSMLVNSTSTTKSFDYNPNPITMTPAMWDPSIYIDNNSTEEPLERNIYIMPLYQQLIWCIIFGTIVFVAAGGNIIVIWIVLTNKRMRTVTNYFLVNLSVADIMVSTLNVIFNFIYMLNGDWIFGDLYCKVSNFIAVLSVAASVFTLMAISIDRYLAIVHPLRPRMSRTTTVNILVVIWIASCLLSLPNILNSITFPETYKNGDSRVICCLNWSDGISTVSRKDYIYNVIILLVTYMLPIASMSYTYFRVGRELWGSQSIGECTAAQMESIKSKRKIVKMMMIVVAIFGVCWAPYHIYFLLAHHYPAITSSKYVQPTYLAIYWLAMSNSVYNPFVYCWMNSRFRQGFRNVFCCNCSQNQNRFEHGRYSHGVAMYSCGSEAFVTDGRSVRFNGNGNIILKSTSVNATNATTMTITEPAITSTGISLQTKTTTTAAASSHPADSFKFTNREML